jgi:hypothetical protein
MVAPRSMASNCSMGRRCSTCHVPALFTEPGWAMHTADEVGIDDFQASRSPEGRYHTTPLKGLWAFDDLGRGA